MTFDDAVVIIAISDAVELCERRKGSDGTKTQKNCETNQHFEAFKDGSDARNRHGLKEGRRYKHQKL